MMWLWLWLAIAARADELPAADILAYRFGPGDEIDVEVVGETDMSGVRRVAGNGTIEIPNNPGQIAVSGLTLDEATQVITEQLGRNVLAHPQVAITVKTFASRKVIVNGGVANPASYSLEKDHTMVSDMLVRAGGLVDASAPTAKVFRDVAGERMVYDVDMEKLNAGDPTADKELYAGDTLYIPPVESVFVDGQVQKPGAIAYRDGMTITQAIAQGGGMLSTAAQRRTYIMRGEERIPVNLKRVLSGADADIALRPSDSIHIPESVF
jgi:polysaccharide export outer membrane protein